jgi:hypothetical protein
MGLHRQAIQRGVFRKITADNPSWSAFECLSETLRAERGEGRYASEWKKWKTLKKVKCS